MACKRSSVQVRYPPLFITRQGTAVYEFFLVLALQEKAVFLKPRDCSINKWRKLPACDESLIAGWKPAPLFKP